MIAGNSLIIFVLMGSSSYTVGAKSTYSARRLNQLSGEKSSKFDSKSEWDQAYSRPSFIFGKSPAKFLAENFDYLPDNAKILDMGMGEGRNAVFSLKKGIKSLALISPAWRSKNLACLPKNLESKSKASSRH